MTGQGGDYTAPHLVLTYDFPPTGGGIARWLAEMARCYPPGGMVVSTGSWPGSARADAEVPQRVDRLSLNSDLLKKPLGCMRWARRAYALVREIGRVDPAELQPELA